ncbi:hypothetical protein EVAR_20484_1 [Eumeta japonica]|uniref:Uncharacterized protein n=1 Tax=Eumeta variegata TaxID=151549 RepID=A0A4C1Y8Y6_EUMVA|nr:hypothetical protein EVAR_20484_1 [Eumeta japonica]
MALKSTTKTDGFRDHPANTIGCEWAPFKLTQPPRTVRSFRNQRANFATRITRQLITSEGGGHRADLKTASAAAALILLAGDGLHMTVPSVRRNPNYFKPKERRLALFRVKDDYECYSESYIKCFWGMCDKQTSMETLIANQDTDTGAASTQDGKFQWAAKLEAWACKVEKIQDEPKQRSGP